MNVNWPIVEGAFVEHLRPSAMQDRGERMVLHPERASELFHLRARPLQRSCRRYLATVKIHIDNERAGIA